MFGKYLFDFSFEVKKKKTPIIRSLIFTVLERKRKVCLIRKCFINCSWTFLDVSSHCNIAHPNKIHHIPLKELPSPKTLAVPAPVLPFIFPDLQTLKLLRYLWLISIPSLVFIVTFSLKAFFFFCLFVSPHPPLPLISTSQFNSYIICACLSGPTHLMHHTYRGSSFPNHEVPCFLSHQLFTHQNSLHKMWTLMSCDLPPRFSYLFYSQHQPSQNFNPLSPSTAYHYFKDPNRHTHTA